ncbi:MAG: gephyrin-like molybdotransferase Glp [Burkholderiaceae bacterium]
MRTLESALIELLARVPVAPPTERIAPHKALGRVLAQTVVSPLDVPGFDNAQMDGYAVCAGEVEPGRAMRVTQRIAAGYVGMPLESGTAARIFTGAPVPPGATAVVMQEDAALTEDGTQVTFQVPPPEGQYLRKRGGDLQMGAEVLPLGTRLQAADLGLLASVGIPEIEVHRRLKLAVFSSGDELVQPGRPLQPGQIYDSNRPMMMALAASLGAEVTDLGVLPDQADATRAALAQAGAAHDVVLTCGGVSVGEEDHIKAAVREIGALDLWQVAIKPGKPFAFGRVGQAAFMGLPGNPVSAWVTFVLLVRPFLLRASGVQRVEPQSVAAQAAFSWTRPDRRQEFLRGWLQADGTVQMHPKQNSQLLTSVTQSACLVSVPPQTPIQIGDSVECLLFESLVH